MECMEYKEKRWHEKLEQTKGEEQMMSSENQTRENMQTTDE